MTEATNPNRLHAWSWRRKVENDRFGSEVFRPEQSQRLPVSYLQF